MHYLLLLCTVLGLNACSTSAQKDRITFADNAVVAHRGAWKAKDLPQNSIASLKYAIALHCVGSEFDVRMTADDILVVTHDADYHELIIEESTYAELAKFPLSNGEPLPKLRDYLIAGMTNNDSTGLVCEIKPSKIEGRNLKITDKVLDLVKEVKAEPFISYYISFSYEVLDRIETVDPKAKTLYLEGSIAPAVIKKDGITGLDYGVYKWKEQPKWIQEAKDLGLILNAWTANKKEDIDWLLANEFNYITTDEPELVFERRKKID